MSPAARVLPMGDRALLAEYGSLEETLSAYRALDASAPAGVVDLVPAARTVLVRLDPLLLPLRAAATWVAATAPIEGITAASDPVVIPMRYDGPDLDDAAAALGIPPGELIRRHAAAEWTSAFIGFAPGFAYLVADDAVGAGLGAEVPRLPTSRPRIPAGSVGLAGPFSGVYPRESPGGWRLIGRTDAVLWDVAADPPALLAPGVRVRFEPLP